MTWVFFRMYGRRGSNGFASLQTPALREIDRGKRAPSFAPYENMLRYAPGHFSYPVVTLYL